MSPSAWFTIGFLVAVAVIVYRQHRQERGYFSGSRPDSNAEAGDDAPPLQAEELAEQLTAVHALLASHRLPCVRITPHPRKPALPWQSRFGGKPYWPRALPFPHAPDGRPLYMLAQLNLAEIPPLPGYPDTGMLQFFVADDDMNGLVMANSLQEVIRANSDGTRSRVVYHPQVIENADALDDDVPHAGQAEIFPLHDEYAVTFTRVEDVPSPTDHHFTPATEPLGAIHDDVMEALWEEETGAGSKFGGYANFTQDDPRHSLPHGERLLLFQLDTAQEEGVDIMWGDSGVGNWFIHRDDLARADFSRVWFNWDCC